MHIILGGTGHVGSAVSHALLAMHEPVTVVTHDRTHAGEWESRGARVAVVDVHDADALHRVLRTGTRIFVLNPPADPSMDTDLEERQTLACILAALDGTAPEKIVAASTYGAQPVQHAGDLGVLYAMEQALTALAVPVSIQRGAYYMSNWDGALDTARSEGVVQSMYPVDFALPMVAPQDLGRFGAKLMTEPASNEGLYYVEGPQRYSPQDVADAFAHALGRPVRVEVTPREGWTAAFLAMGFSQAAAASYAQMTARTLDADFDLPDEPVRGSTTLRDYIAALVQRSG